MSAGGGNNLPETKGVYAYFADGSVSTATSYTAAQQANILGVAVTDTYDSKLVRFVISKYQYNQTIMFGAYNVDLTGKVLITSDQTAALKDMKGKTNSKAIIAACAGKTGSSAAVTCLECAKTTHFPNGEGYCPSLGEWQVAYNNKSAIDTMMTAIGGTAIPDCYNVQDDFITKCNTKCYSGEHTECNICSIQTTNIVNADTEVKIAAWYYFDSRINYLRSYGVRAYSTCSGRYFTYRYPYCRAFWCPGDLNSDGSGPYAS